MEDLQTAPSRCLCGPHWPDSAVKQQSSASHKRFAGWPASVDYRDISETRHPLLAVQDVPRKPYLGKPRGSNPGPTQAAAHRRFLQF